MAYDDDHRRKRLKLDTSAEEPTFSPTATMNRHQREEVDFSAPAQDVRKFVSKLPPNLRSKQEIMQAFDALIATIELDKPCISGLTDQERMTKIFILLCGFDRRMRYIQLEGRFDRPQQPKALSTRRRSAVPQGIGYETAAPWGSSQPVAPTFDPYAYTGTTPPYGYFPIAPPKPKPVDFATLAKNTEMAQKSMQNSAELAKKNANPSGSETQNPFGSWTPASIAPWMGFTASSEKDTRTGASQAQDASVAWKPASLASVMSYNHSASGMGPRPSSEKTSKTSATQAQAPMTMSKAAPTTSSMSLLPFKTSSNKSVAQAAYSPYSVPATSAPGGNEPDDLDWSTLIDECFSNASAYYEDVFKPQSADLPVPAPPSPFGWSAMMETAFDTVTGQQEKEPPKDALPTFDYLGNQEPGPKWSFFDPPSPKKKTSPSKQPGGRATEPASGCSSKKTRSEKEDELVKQVLAGLVNLLPPIYCTQPQGDITSRPALKAFFTRSSFIDKVAELLRNGSLEDVSNRASLYHPLVQFMHKLVGLPPFRDLVQLRREANPGSSYNLLNVALGIPSRLRGAKDETNQSLWTSMEDLRGMAKAAWPVENRRVNALFYSINSLDRQVSSMDRQNSSMDIVMKDDRVQKSTVPTWQTELAWAEGEEKQLLETFAFTKEAKDIATKPILPGRMKKLLHDHQKLASELPAAGGIFVRYCSSRPDIMKILMVGPEGTPYEHGLFEFDLFCDADYPTAPPRLMFKTTGGGSVDFNPNLYNNGKVCLSLLGTWGNNWNKKTSNIFQVLISIRAMILCPQPYCNEPGFEGQYGTELSKRYNRATHPKTVQHAMMPWVNLNRNEMSKCVWAEIIHKHFEQNERAILTTVYEWIRDRPGQEGIAKYIRMPEVTHPAQLPGSLSEKLKVSLEGLRHPGRVRKGDGSHAVTLGMMGQMGADVDNDPHFAPISPSD